MDKTRITLLSIIMVLAGFAVIGGTYAYLTFSANVTNGNYNVSVACFDIDYDIENDDDAGTTNSQITGTLFQSANPSGGLSGRMMMKVKSTCTLNGTGVIYLNVASTTSSALTKTVNDHCEDTRTLTTLNDYTTSAACTAVSNATWVTAGSALKYAIYTSTDLTQIPVSVGYITNSFIGTNTAIYSNFSVTQQQGTYYVYIWLDGYVADSSYVNLPFSGYTYTVITQTETE